VADVASVVVLHALWVHSFIRSGTVMQAALFRPFRATTVLLGAESRGETRGSIITGLSGRAAA
jgi:hypothetical protein